MVVGGSVVRLELRKASLASFAISLLSSLSSSINQIDGQTLTLFLIKINFRLNSWHPNSRMTSHIFNWAPSSYLTWLGRGRHWDRRISIPETPWSPEWRYLRSRDREWSARGTSSIRRLSCWQLWWKWWGQWWYGMIGLPLTCTQQAVHDFQKCTWASNECLSSDM